MRISRIDSFGGSCPPLNPSMKSEPPFGPGARAGQRLQRIGQVIGIVREGREVFAAECQRRRVIVRLGAHYRSGVRFHRDLLLLGENRKLDCYIHHSTSGHSDRLRYRREAGEGHFHRVLARRHTVESETAVRLRLRRFVLAAAGQHNGSRRNHRA